MRSISPWVRFGPGYLPALGVIRFLGEAYVGARWLTDSADPDERQRRAAAQADYTLLDIAKNIGDDPAVVQAVFDQRPRIREAIGLAGDIEFSKRPSTRDLFNQYLSGTWPILSQMGSHPGFQQIVLFFLDWDARKVDIRWNGAQVQRAAFLAAALEVYARFSELVAREIGDDEWTRRLIEEIVAVKPLLEEVKRRWDVHWQG